MTTNYLDFLIHVDSNFMPSHLVNPICLSLLGCVPTTHDDANFSTMTTNYLYFFIHVDSTSMPSHLVNHLGLSLLGCVPTPNLKDVELGVDQAQQHLDILVTQLRIGSLSIIICQHLDW